MKRKHVFRRQKRDQSSSISSDEAVLSAEEGSIGGSQLTSASLSLSSASSRDSRLSSASGLKADSRVSDFIDLSFWKRKEICCGTIFVGPNGETRTLETYFESFIKFPHHPGEAIVDPRLLRACPRQHKTQPLPELPYSIHTIENMIATELKVMIVSFFLFIISQIYIFVLCSCSIERIGRT